MDIDLMARSSRWEKSVSAEKDAARRKKEKESIERKRILQAQKEAQDMAIKRNIERALEEERLEEQRLKEFSLTNGINFLSQYSPFRISDSEDDKIILPQSALEILTQQEAFTLGPFMFRITLVGTIHVTHCGVREFTADEGTVGLPLKVIESLYPDDSIQINETRISVKYVRLPKITYVKLQPKAHQFSNVGPIKAVLEENLRRHTTLSIQDVVTVWYRGKPHSMRVVDMKPETCGSLIDTDVEVDLDVSEEYDKKIQEEALAASSNTSSSKARRLESPSSSLVDKSAVQSSFMDIEDDESKHTEDHHYPPISNRITPQLPSEPSIGEIDVITCRIRLSSGKSVTRRFHRHNPMEFLFRSLSSNPDTAVPGAFPGKEATLTMRQPIRVFTEMSVAGQTFEELGVTSSQETFLLSFL